MPAWLEYWPVTNGTSSTTLSVASWLSIVTAEGVDTMFVSASLLRARIMAANDSPPPDAIVPTPMVVPVRRVEAAARADEPLDAAPIRSTMLVPPTGETKPPAGSLVLGEYAAQLMP